jgi:WhiB family redox-sensing transcriptional regulator
MRHVPGVGPRPRGRVAQGSAERRLSEVAPVTPVTRADYQAGCRTPECRAANAAYQARRQLRKTLPLVAAGRARAYVRELLAGGMSLHRIAEKAGVPASTVYRLLGAMRGYSRTRRIRPTTESAILSVHPDAECETGWHDDRRHDEPWWLDATLAPPTDSDQPWRADAACRDPGIPTRVFFAYRGDLETMRAAQKICAGCTVRVQCLAYALAVDAEGIWGGTTHQQRERMQGRRGGLADTA